MKGEMAEGVTYEEGHGECVEYKNEQEFEEVGSVRCKSSHPVCSERKVVVKYEE